MADALLTVEGLSLGYGRGNAVHDVSFSVREGTTVCLIGANGAGKTTTMRGLSGLLRPRSGRILFRGQPIGGRSPHAIARSGLIQVPEGRQIFAELTVAENLRIGAYRVAGTTEFERRRHGVLARFPRLAERLHQRGGLLSGGEQQMLAIGRALMADPQLLLLDEPSMGLSPLFVEEVLAVVEELKGEGRTILLVEQNARAALEIADYAYVLEAGGIKFHGTSSVVASNDEILKAYLGA